MRLVSITSGSNGNCIYIGSEKTHILVDTGISNKRVEKGLGEIGLKPSEMDGIFITHEHSDHVCGLGVISRKYGIPIYGTKKTLEEIRKMSSLGEIPQELYRPVMPDEMVSVGDMQVHPFSISHDAKDPVAYRVECGKRAMAVATDMGVYSDYVIRHLLDLDAVLLESNHDIHMLQTGRYPYYLKQRIMGEKGHLSNESAGHLLCEILHDNLKYVLLGHLSHDNNYPELAYEAVRMEVTMGDNSYQASDFNIAVARRGEMSDIITV